MKEYHTGNENKVLYPARWIDLIILIKRSQTKDYRQYSLIYRKFKSGQN
jgi:hypothetical protein